jgi:hypothetical protein
LIRIYEDKEGLPKVNPTANTLEVLGVILGRLPWPELGLVRWPRSLISQSLSPSALSGTLAKEDRV